MYFEVIMGISLHISSLSPLFFSSLAFLRYKEHCFFIMDFKIIASLKKKEQQPLKRTLFEEST